MFFGSSGLISETSFADGTPDFDCTRTASSCPTLPNRRAAVGGSNSAKVAPPTEVPPENLTIPAIWKRWAAPVVWTLISSPTEKPSLSAVPLSIAICFSPCGQEPLVSSVGLKRWSFGSAEKPSVGAPPVDSTLPSLPISLTWSLWIAPAA